MAYFDHNATSPLSASARGAWLAAQDEAWQNPGGGYRAAARVRALIDRGKERLAVLLGVEPRRVMLTSGATEAANAVLAHLAQRSAGGETLLLGPTEHACVRATAESMFPGRIEFLAADEAGRVRLEALRSRLRRGAVAAVAVMAANNETGVLQPPAEIAAICNEAGVPHVCDAVQWLGRLPAAELGQSGFVFGSAHKFGGPKGCGFLLLDRVAVSGGFGSLRGGGQQDGRRSGTEDWPALAAMVAALEDAERLAGDGATVRDGWRTDFERALADAIPGVRIVGESVPRLWNTVMAVLPTGDAQRWVTKLDRRGFEVSTAAACSAAHGRGSAVLAALGWSPEQSRRALRFSAGWETTRAQWNELLSALAEVRSEIGRGPVVL